VLALLKALRVNPEILLPPHIPEVIDSTGQYINNVYVVEPRGTGILAADKSRVVVSVPLTEKVIEGKGTTFISVT